MVNVSPAVAKLLVKSADDVVITFAKRSPLCKAKRGGFKDMESDELLLSFFNAVVPELQINPALVEDITIGNVVAPGIAYIGRAAALAAGFPESTACQIVNRFCSSGLMAVSIIANNIRNNEIEVGLAVGFESMSATPDRSAAPFCEAIKANSAANDCAMPMGWTSENVASDFNITRERMDDLAAKSNQKADAAQKAGFFDSEILPVQALQLPNPSVAGASRIKVTVTKDDGIRSGTTAAGLGKIRSAFPQWGKGQTTGGNASQVTDGAAAVLMMKRSKAEELGLTILGKHCFTSVAGLAPRIMGIGPSYAIPRLLKMAGLTKEDVDLWEVNEAFASMYTYMIDHYGLPEDRTNVHGGAIALGHPLGATGARQVATGLSAIRRRGGSVLVTSMCIGSGQGASSVFVAEY